MQSVFATAPSPGIFVARPRCRQFGTPADLLQSGPAYAPGASSGVIDGIAVNVYQVPAGKRLVITYIGYYGLSGGTFRAITVTAHPADKNQPITSQAVAQCTLLGTDFIFASQQVFLFGNPGDQIDVALHADANGHFTGALIAGYLVNLP